MSCYLVTGAAGFIGSHIVENLLKNGHEVVGLDNFNDNYSYKTKTHNILEAIGFEQQFLFSNDRESDIYLIEQRARTDKFRLYAADICDKDNLNKIFQAHKIEGIVHAAALAGVRPSLENPLEYEKVNVRGSNIIMEYARKYGIRKVIMASSSSVYGNNKKKPFKEIDKVDFPISPYASTKKAMEVMSHVYHALYDFNIILLRFFTVYGPRQRPDLAIFKFTKLLYEEQPIPVYGDGSTSRDYTYIDDIIQGVMASIEYLENNRRVFEIINLGENEVISLNEMIETLEKHTGLKAVRDSLPMQPGDVKSTNADITKAKKLLGYEPSTSFDEGVEKFITWYKAKYVDAK